MSKTKKIDSLIKQINEKEPQRSFSIVRSDVDEETRTVPLAFSSEEPYQRWWGTEILDHSSDSVDLSRLNNSAPILINHDMNDQVGVVEPGTATIDSDKRGRLVARFSKSPKAEQEFQDILDGIKTKVSVGYRIEKMVLESEEDGVETYRVTKWQPYEVSIVSVPADDTVGVGRSIEENLINEKKIMGKEKENQDPTIDVEKVAAETRSNELGRIKQINQFKNQFSEKGYNLDEVAERHIEQGSDFMDFKAEALEKMQNDLVEQRNVSKLDLSEKETKQFSLLRAINAQVTGDWRGAEFERECSEAIAKRAGKQANGIFVPSEVQQRKQQVGVPADGGNLVGTEHRPEAFVDLLKDNMVVKQLGAQMLEGLIQDQQIPKKTAASTAYWVGEDVDVTDSDMAFGLLNLSPKTVGAAIPITRKMLKQGLPSIEALCWADMAEEIALAIDLAALTGDGLGSNPTGITETAGVNTATVSTPAAPTWDEIVAFETAVAADNALKGAFNYVTTAAMRGTLKTTKKDAGSGLFLMENGETNGYPVVLKNSLAANTIIFGNFADVLIGLWGTLDVVYDPATKAAAGGLVVRAFQDVDVAIRRPESFCINA